jgi:hypothetical protein
VYNGEFDLAKILKKNICHQSIFYKRCVFDLTGFFNQRYTLCADYDVSLQLFAKAKPYYLNLIICVFQGGATSSNMYDKEFTEDFGMNIVTYFRPQLFKNDFIGKRNFILEASRKKNITLSERFFYRCIWFLLTMKAKINFF